MDRRSFGRRGVSEPSSVPQVVAHAAPAEAVRPEPVTKPSIDDELDAWKQQRRYRVPWKQLCLMASICFGIASLVLPDDVNRAVNWLLYGLTAMSLYAWYSGRRIKT